MTTMLPTITSTARPMDHAPGRQHPGAPTSAIKGTDRVVNEIQHALVEARMTTRLSEPATERLARRPRPAQAPGLRGRVGRVLIGLGTSIAGTSEERTEPRPS